MMSCLPDSPPSLHSTLLATWIFPLSPRHLENLNLFQLQDALNPAFIWNMPDGVCVRGSVKEAKIEFIKSLYNATNSAETSSVDRRVHEEDKHMDPRAVPLCYC